MAIGRDLCVENVAFVQKKKKKKRKKEEEKIHNALAFKFLEQLWSW